MMRLSVAQCSHRGGRASNEDYLGFCANETVGCFVLADGTGGYSGGAFAAETVVKEVLAFFSSSPEVSHNTIEGSITTARQALAQARQQRPDFKTMNTTIATLMIDTRQPRAYWSHLGDSRIYLFRNGRARALTSDHSLLQSMIDAGLASGGTRGKSERNTLYAAVGSGEVPERAICEVPVELFEGDAFLLCSDGFWEVVGEEMMETQLLYAASPEQWIENMVKHFPEPETEDQDNFSALAVWVGEREEVTRIFMEPLWHSE